jgi:hypothetical protein
MFYAPTALHAVKCWKYSKRWHKLAHSEPDGSDSQMASIKECNWFRREALRAQLRLTHPELYLYPTTAQWGLNGPSAQQEIT